MIMKRIYALVFAFLAVTLVAFYCRADLTAPPRTPALAAASAVFTTHPGMFPIPYLELDVKLKNPEACKGTMTAKVGDRDVLNLTRNAAGFHGSVAPPPPPPGEFAAALPLDKPFLEENAPLRIACDGGLLRDTGLVYHAADIAYAGW